MKKCPRCRGEIKSRATRCKHCCEDLPESLVPAVPAGDGCLKVAAALFALTVLGTFGEVVIKGLGGVGVVAIVAIGTAGYVVVKIHGSRHPPQLPGQGDGPGALPPPHPEPIALDLSKAACAFCDQPLKDRKIILCPKCQTPLHADCWEENGQKCATYGCR